jgi:hypothetical protein
MPGDLFLAAHPFRQRLAVAQLVDFFLPAHDSVPVLAVFSLRCMLHGMAGRWVVADRPDGH